MSEKSDEPKKKKTPNLLQRRTVGAIKPREPYVEQNTQPAQQKSSSDLNIQKVTRKQNNQKRSIKISSETYKDMSVLKTMENIRFDYEIIQMLIDDYQSRMSEADRRRFTVLRENY